jgi:N-methylhydantoinase B
VAHAPLGRDGGLPGAAGVVGLRGGKTLRTKGFQLIPEGERLLLHLPGGGGMGDPATREPALVVQDVRNGVVSPAAARELYHVALDAEGGLDAAATLALRRRRPD